MRISSVAGPILAEGSIYERLRRHQGIPFDPLLGLGGLIYDDAARVVLQQTQLDYLAISARHGLPMLMSTATWRASSARIRASGFSGRSVNEDNVAFVRELAPSAIIAGVTGPAGDAYTGRDALSAESAVRYHELQAEALSGAGVDLLFAATLPALSESVGIARAFGATGTQAVLSFVLRPDGTLLDGTSLDLAIDTLDGLGTPPLGYFANCVHPSVLASALATTSQRSRVLGIQANTSSMTPEELDGSTELHGADAEMFADEVTALRDQGMLVFGGCCGTDATHIDAIARRLVA